MPCHANWAWSDVFDLELDLPACLPAPLCAFQVLTMNSVRCIMLPTPSQLLHSTTQSRGVLLEAVRAQLIPPLRICSSLQGCGEPGTDYGP